MLSPPYRLDPTRKHTTLDTRPTPILFLPTNNHTLTASNRSSPIQQLDHPTNLPQPRHPFKPVPIHNHNLGAPTVIKLLYFFGGVVFFFHFIVLLMAFCFYSTVIMKKPIVWPRVTSSVPWSASDRQERHLQLHCRKFLIVQVCVRPCWPSASKFSTLYLPGYYYYAL